MEVFLPSKTIIDIKNLATPVNVGLTMWKFNALHYIGLPYFRHPKGGHISMTQPLEEKKVFLGRSGRDLQKRFFLNRSDTLL